MKLNSDFWSQNCGVIKCAVSSTRFAGICDCSAGKLRTQHSRCSTQTSQPSGSFVTAASLIVGSHGPYYWKSCFSNMVALSPGPCHGLSPASWEMLLPWEIPSPSVTCASPELVHMESGPMPFSAWPQVRTGWSLSPPRSSGQFCSSLTVVTGLGADLEDGWRKASVFSPIKNRTGGPRGWSDSWTEGAWDPEWQQVAAGPNLPWGHWVC